MSIAGPAPRSRRTALAGTALAAVLATAACGSSGNGGGNFNPQSTAPTSAASSAQTDASTSSAPTTSSSSSPSDSLESLLIDASDIGSGFAKVANGTESDPLPCTPNDPPLEQQFPPAGKSEASFANSAKTYFVTQTAESFDDSATAQKVVSATETGFGCSTGKLQGETLKIVPVKTSTPTGLDVLKRWDAAIPSQNALVTVVLFSKGSTAELVTFVASKSAASSVNIGGANVAAIQKLITGA